MRRSSSANLSRMLISPPWYTLIWSTSSISISLVSLSMFSYFRKSSQKRIFSAYAIFQFVPLCFQIGDNRADGFVLPLVIFAHVAVVVVRDVTIFPVLVKCLFVSHDFGQLFFFCGNQFIQPYRLALFKRGQINLGNDSGVANRKVYLLSNCVQCNRFKPCAFNRVHGAGFFERLLYVPHL